MTLTDEQLAEILAGCEGVTPGPWMWDAGLVPPDGPERYADIYADGGDTIIASFNDSIFSGRRNAEHIARLDPQTVSALVTELQERRAGEAELRRLLWLFREFWLFYVTQTKLGSGRSHPLWEMIAEALGDDNGRGMTEAEWQFITGPHFAVSSRPHPERTER